MASSSVILAGPGGAWPRAEPGNHTQAKAAHATPRIRIARICNFETLAFKGALRFRESVCIFCYPDIKRRQQNNAQRKSGKQAAHDDDRERPLRIGSDLMRE